MAEKDQFSSESASKNLAELKTYTPSAFDSYSDPITSQPTLEIPASKIECQDSCTASSECEGSDDTWSRCCGEALCEIMGRVCVEICCMALFKC
uniref:G protein-coupled receptor n=1 Tax=Caenorhabditis tropicalis TaxID=1561998 RepID=A0A1I7U9J5_9PELO